MDTPGIVAVMIIGLAVVAVGIVVAIRVPDKGSELVLPVSDLIAPRSDPAVAAAPASERPRALSAATIFWCVFGALWAFSITGGLAYLILYAFFHALNS